MKYTVDGEIVMKFSVLVNAESEEEAARIAEEYAPHNVTAEYVNIDGVYEGDVNN